MNKIISINPGRRKVLKDGKTGTGPVVYWMSRDQRSDHNWALLEGARLSSELDRPLVCVFTLMRDYPCANYRHYAFMLKGLREVEHDLVDHGIPLIILNGNPPETLAEFLGDHDAAVLICDFDPLRIKRQWQDALLPAISCPVIEVDAHNIVPCRIASQKQETGAYTFRPKIAKLMDEYLDAFPPLPKFTKQRIHFDRPDFESLIQKNLYDSSVPEVEGFIPGSSAAQKVMKKFIRERLADYNEFHGDPNAAATSDLSPYLHFGQISAQQIVMEIYASCEPTESRKSFIEQLVVRRELSDNFCFYNPDYDTYESFPAWAKRSHEKHIHDDRDYIYSVQEFEQACTHDELWNAAQREIIRTGKMHNYMRMYWAKKILEWTKTPQEAMKIAVYLNDKYELDGRDPNGYAGCAWSIGGVHDRAWFDRRVFGQIRYMNANGCARKFDVKEYCRRFAAGENSSPS